MIVKFHLWKTSFCNGASNAFVPTNTKNTRTAEAERVCFFCLLRLHRSLAFGSVRIPPKTEKEHTERCTTISSDEGFDEIMVLPPSRPAVSRCPLDICIWIGSNPS